MIIYLIFQMVICYIVVLFGEMVDFMYLDNLSGTIFVNSFCDISEILYYKFLYFLAEKHAIHVSIVCLILKDGFGLFGKHRRKVFLLITISQIYLFSCPLLCH